MFILLFIVLVNFVGLGALIPIIPFAVTQVTGASETLLTLLLAEFALASFLFNPIWGRLSDLFGRKLILIISLFISSIAQIWFALSDDLLIMFLSRAIAGAASGNIGVIQAIIADSTNKEDRAKNMGYLGAAIGLGFIFGPILGAFASSFSESVHTGPFLIAGFFSFSSMLFAMKYVKNDRKRNQIKRNNISLLFKDILDSGLLVFAFCWCAISFSFAQVEAIFVISLRDSLNFNTFKSGLFFTYIGALIFIVQGFLVGPMTKRYGDLSTGRIGLYFLTLGQVLTAILVIISIEVLGYKILLFGTLLSTLFICLGFGLCNPAISSASSKIVNMKNMGASMGVFQGFGSLGQVFGLGIAGPLYAIGGSSLPFLFGGITIALIILLLFPKLILISQS